MNVLIDQNKLDVLATAIANKSGEPLKMAIAEMVEAVDGIETGGGGITPTGNIDITQAGQTDVTNYATATVPDGILKMSESLETTPYISINNNGLITADINDTLSSFPVGSSGWLGAEENAVTIYISGYNTYQLPTQSATTITPTESQQTAVASGKYTTGAITVSAISSTYVGTGITRHSSSDLTASGATVTVPSGYYSAQASKSVASGTATAPTTISGTSATVSTGTNTLTLSKTISVTPQVTTAGYVSAGTAGNSAVSLTANVTTQGAQTIYPSSSDQTINSGRYLTGNQTIKAVTTSNLTADNIKSGVTVTVGDSADADRVLSVTGTYSGGGGSSMNVQIAQSTNRATSSTYTNLISLTCTTAGKYDIYWDCFRSSTGGTNGSQLYIGGQAYGTANTTFTNHVQTNHLTNVTLAANQTVAVYARSRGNSYYAYVGTLVIKQTA